jgi:hypothetical protein
MSAGKAANAQKDAANQANSTQQAMYNQTRSDLMPYSQAGASATNALASLMGLSPGGASAATSVSDYNSQIQSLQKQRDAIVSSMSGSNKLSGVRGGWAGILGLNNNQSANQLTAIDAQIADLMAKRNTAATNAAIPQTSVLDSPLLKSFNMTQAELEQTPGYQFNLTQGLKAVQNSAAARGLGVSGAAQKGAASYATGLADSTYQNQFNNYVTNQTNQYNRLMGLANQGENAAAQTGAYGTQTAANIGNNLTGAANAQGAAYLAQGNAIANAANNVGGYYALRGMYG